MRLVPVPVRRMRLVLSHASCCAIELSELERRRGGGIPILSLDGIGAFVLSLQRCLAPTGQDAQSRSQSRFGAAKQILCDGEQEGPVYSGVRAVPLPGCEVGRHRG